MDINANIEVFAESLCDAIESKNLPLVKDLTSQLYTLTITNTEAALWLTMPVNLNRIHVLLVDNFKVHPRALMLKNRVTSRVKRAVLLSKAIEIAVSRL